MKLNLPIQDGKCIRVATLSHFSSSIWKWSGIATMALVCLLSLAPEARARVWHDTLNRSWEGEFGRLEGASAVFVVNGKEYPFPLSQLRMEDRIFITQSLAQQHLTAPAATATPAPALSQTSPSFSSSMSTAVGKHGTTFGGTELSPGTTVQVSLPLDAKAAKEISSCYGNKPTTHIQVAIAVPKDFDPAKPQRMLITSASTTGAALSIPNMQTYTATALERGWMVMSADGEFGKPHDDSIDFRAAMLEVMLKEIGTTWPQAKGAWSFATAGFSGGAGYASHQADTMAAQEWHVIGMLLMNGCYSPDMWDKNVKGPKARARKVPVFYSAGQSDPTSKPDMMKTTIEAAKKGGFHRLRSEWHPGGHSPSKEHIAVALEWFESLEKEVKGEH